MSELAATYTTTIDRIPTADLAKLYGKTRLYTEYFKALKIEPTRDGNASYITPEEAGLVDRYHAVRGQGKAALQAFLDELFADLPSSLERSEQPTWLLFAEAIASRLTPQLPDPLLPQRRLQEIADRGWVVSSSQLRSVLGVSVLGEGRLGFRFVRVGRSGREGAWRVEKASF